jgi:hypothetical protein
MSSTPENATVRDANLLNAARLVLGAIAKGSDELTGAMQQLALACEEAPERLKVKGTAGPYTLCLYSWTKLQRDDTSVLRNYGYGVLWGRGFGDRRQSRGRREPWVP